MIEKVYRNTEIDFSILDLELSFKLYEKVKVDPALIKNDDDVTSFVLDNKKYKVPLCVSLIRNVDNLVGKKIYISGHDDITDHWIDNYAKDRGDDKVFIILIVPFV